MRRFYNIFVLLAILVFNSCYPDLKFEDAQPTEDKDEIRFKRKFQGTYFCLADSSILIIDNNAIIQKWHSVSKLPMAQLDTIESIEIKNDSIFYENNIDPLPIEIIGDTVILTWKFEKSIFKISENQVLRYTKGISFLNFQMAENLWTVKTLVLSKNGVLTINRIKGGEEEIEELKNMTSVEVITNEEEKIVGYKVNPTKKELKKILKSNLVKEGTKFQKIKN